MAMSRGVKTGIIGAVCAGMFGVAAYGAYNIYDGLNGSGGGGGGHPQTVADTGPPEPKDVTSTADDFLSAWSSGDDTAAAALTDSVQTATDALASYRTQAHVTKVTATPTTTTGATVSFTVRAALSYQGIAKPWSYTSTLTVARDAAGKPAVKWAPSVVYPDLAPGQTLVTGLATTPDLDLVDRHGTKMTAAQYPGLTDVFSDLRKRYADKGLGGTAGIETYIRGEDGTQVKTLYVLKAGRNAQLKTTLDAKIQAAAEKSVKQNSPAGVTAVDTDNGDILAMASNPSGGENYALARQAPGSTFKIVTAAALMMADPPAGKPVLTPKARSQCFSGYALPGGKAYKNVTPDKADATLAWDFEQSCNTGFIRLADYLQQDSLTKVGATYFGLGPTWYTGTGTQEGVIPGGQGDEMSSEMIGQGQVLMNTLDMATVAATVREGKFHQPSILNDHGLIENRGTVPVKPLPGTIRTYLQQMMRGTVDHGTASGVLRGLNTPYGAKTGSAEEGGDAQANGWFTAYSGHVAAAGIVVGGGHGNKSAGPIVADVLAAS